MFDMGFTEMMLIGIVALLVIGPERLPGVARTAGKYVGRLKRFMTSVKADVEQELRADELRDILSKQQQELDSLKNTISDAGKDIEHEVDVKAWGEPSEAAKSVAKPANAEAEAESETPAKADAEAVQEPAAAAEKTTSKTGS